MSGGWQIDLREDSGGWLAVLSRTPPAESWGWTMRDAVLALLARVYPETTTDPVKAPAAPVAEYPPMADGAVVQDPWQGKEALAFHLAMRQAAAKGAARAVTPPLGGVVAPSLADYERLLKIELAVRDYEIDRLKIRIGYLESVVGRRA